MMDYYFKLVVSCFTYNQSGYILDALSGFTMQQTDFPFVCCIVDDASTDDEQSVILNYLHKNFEEKDENVSYKEETDYAHIYFAQHKENKNCYFAVLLLKENHYSKKKSKIPYLTRWQESVKYVAWCEGDDYWIHPAKLQMQVNWMDQHPECAYLFSDRYIDNIRRKERAEVRYRKNQYTIRDVSRGLIPGMQTIMFRRDLTQNQLLKTQGVNGDRLFAYAASTMGEIHCLHEITAVYRNTGDGVSTGIRDEALFEHTVNDFYRFHNNLQIDDRLSYLIGQSQYLREYGVGHNKMYRLMFVYSGYKKIDNSISVFEFMIILISAFIRKFKIGFNLMDDPRMAKTTLS